MFKYRVCQHDRHIRWNLPVKTVFKTCAPSSESSVSSLSGESKVNISRYTKMDFKNVSDITDKIRVPSCHKYACQRADPNLAFFANNLKPLLWKVHGDWVVIKFVWDISIINLSPKFHKDQTTSVWVKRGDIAVGATCWHSHNATLPWQHIHHLNILTIQPTI